ncbi:MAG: ribosome-associated protein [Gammaproteobacteria bacterium]|nr:ribosome-associated protein [Gammaproteobacteria bacterium]
MHDEFDDFPELEEEDILISKSQLKRESEALQVLGEALVALPDSKLARIPMPERLADAVAEARRIHAHGGRKRQLQYIGKIMRSIEAEPIQQALDALENEGARQNARFHRLEQWRDRLIAEGDGLIGELLEEYPQADRQHLRQLIRNAQREQAKNQVPKSARELFRYLRELDEVGR